MIDFERDSVPEVDATGVRRLTDLCGKQMIAEKAVERLEQELKDAKKTLRRLNENDVPSLMEELGVKSLTLASGRKVAITETLYASVPKKNMPRVADWLVDHDLKALLKDTVGVTFRRDETEAMEKVVESLRSMGFSPATQHTVNTGSLKSAINEHMSEGTDVPLELFGAYILKRSVIE